MGGARLRVQVDAPEDAEVEGAFEALDDIVSIQQTNGYYELAAGGDADPAADIFHLCADRGWVLTELTPLESSLEDVFRELTEDPEAPAGVEATPTTA
jgi:ABC-2 type transport system ATP-binding protein